MLLVSVRTTTVIFHKECEAHRRGFLRRSDITFTSFPLSQRLHHHLQTFALYISTHLPGQLEHFDYKTAQ